MNVNPLTRLLLRIICASLLVTGGAGCDHFYEPRVRSELQVPLANHSDLHRFDKKSCAEIYAEIYRLFPATYAETHEFTSDERNAGIGFLGLVFEPAFFGFGYTAATEQLKEKRVQVASTELDELRRANALKACWLK